MVQAIDLQAANQINDPKIHIKHALTSSNTHTPHTQKKEKENPFYLYCNKISGLKSSAFFSSLLFFINTNIQFNININIRK